MTQRLELFRPSLGAQELSAVAEVLESGWIGYGQRCIGVERSWADAVNAKFGVATNSCTSALQLALRLRHVGPGDEVIVPTLTFAATAQAVCAVGARPVFCDVLPDTLLIDLASAQSKITSNTRAVIPVLYGGQPIDIGREWCGQPVIYDCAHAAGSSFDASGKTCCWSFHAVKNLGCGDGGMLTLSEEEDCVRAKALSWHGIPQTTWDRSAGRHYTWNYDISEIGIKGQMNDITAAILSVQITRMDEIQAARRNIAYQYLRQLDGTEVVCNRRCPDKQSWHLFVIKSAQRDELATYLHDRNIMTGVHYKPLHLHPVFANGCSLPFAEQEWSKLLSLPIHPGLSSSEVDWICKSINTFKPTNKSQVAA